MRVFTIICLVLMPATLFCQEIELAGSTFQETVTENARVSGDIVMGVMLVGDSPVSVDPSVRTGNHWMASDGETQVCVRIVTKNGRYEAENTYVVPQRYNSAAAVFRYGGTRRDILSEEQATALVKTGACGSRDAVVVPILSHDEPFKGSEILRVFINASGNPVDVAWGRGRDQVADCTDVTELDGLKYTARCDVPIASLPRTAPVELTFFIARGNTEEDFQVSVLPPYVRE